MKIGFYIADFKNTKLLEEIYEFVEANQSHDFSLFFDEIGYNPYKIKCGIFNSTELWSFDGVLITTCDKTYTVASNVVNNIDILYFNKYVLKENIFNLIKLKDKIDIISDTEKKDHEIYRLIGKKSLGISSNISEIAEIIKGKQNERKSNINYVYQT